MTTATKAQKAKADNIGGIVVQRLGDDSVHVVDRHELDYPAQAQRVLYVAEPLTEDDPERSQQVKIEGDSQILPDSIH